MRHDAGTDRAPDAPHDGSGIGGPRSPPAATGGALLDERFGFNLDDESWFARLGSIRDDARLWRLGGYEVLGEAGRGGQGVVYKARQPGTGRIVALKRMGVAGSGSSAFAARLEREAQLASSLNHPNIVTVFGVEVVDGQPLLVMEWVGGVPIDRWAAVAAGAPAGRSVDTIARRKTREILDVFLLVCDAVQHAHRRGVIHRDLKPSNILVDAEDRPHVLDFGIGKLFDTNGDAPALTRTGQFLGTPAYAAPEQFRGGPADVDTRTDVYALGAILHELLTGRTPLTDLGYRTQPRNRQLRFATPTDGQPGWGRRLDVEVEAIILKALAAEKDDRYASVEALAADVRRYLERRPVTAYSSGTAYRVRKFVRRNVWLCSLAGLGGAAVVFLAARSTLLSYRLSIEAQESREAAEREHAARIHAEESARASREFGAQAARHAAQNQAATEFLTGLLSAQNSADGKNVALPTAVLEQACQLLDAGALREQPEVEQRLRFQIGRAYHDARQFEPAAVQFEAAVEASRRAYGNEHTATSASLCNLGVAQSNLGRRDQGLANLREGIAIAERIQAGGAGATWLGELGATLRARGDHAEADHFVERAAERFTEIARHAEAARAYHEIARVHRNRKSWAAAETAARKSLASWDADGAKPGSRRALVLEILGQARLAQGDLEQAREYFQQSLDMFRAVAKYPNYISNAGLQLGETLQRLGRPADALGPLRESLLLNKSTRPDDESMRRRQLRLGVSLLATGDEAAAREMFAAALVRGAAGVTATDDIAVRVDSLIVILRASDFRIDDNPSLSEAFADLRPLLNPPPIGDAGPAAGPLPAKPPAADQADAGAESDTPDTGGS